MIEGRIIPEASFVKDLLVDSITLVGLMLHLEEMGIIMTARDVDQTVGDAYRVYKGRYFGD
ncbi:MAG: hypothetical protein JSV61_05625 [Anaerolineales bacterium]|nr:MAG: hypothetical protein JSV61_05625 [Anaerolineales bacterium]